MRRLIAVAIVALSISAPRPMADFGRLSVSRSHINYASKYHVVLRKLPEPGTHPIQWPTHGQNKLPSPSVDTHEQFTSLGLPEVSAHVT